MKAKNLGAKMAIVMDKLETSAKVAGKSIKDLAALMHEQKEAIRKDLRKQGIFISKRTLKRGLKHIYPLGIPDKIGRNEPCKCGSGLKYKKCCLK